MALHGKKTTSSREFESSKQGQISRARFLGLGLSTALLSSMLSLFTAKSRTVNFDATTSGKLSDCCLGDGSDQTCESNKCLRNNLFVGIEEPPAGVGYGFRANGSGGGGLLLKSAHEINALGADSKLLRVGKWQRNGKQGQCDECLKE